MKSYNYLARQAYAMYSKRAGNKTFDGKPLPLWAELGAEMQACWIEAVKQVVHDLAPIH